MVYGKMLSLRVLLDGFSHDDSAVLKVPLWVKFPFLPQKCWTKSDSGKIGSKIVVPDGDSDDSGDVLEEVVPQEVVADLRVEERFVHEGLSYSNAFLSDLNLVGDSEEDLSDEAEDSGEELEPDVDDVGDFEEEWERDDFIEIWVSFLDFPLKFT
ncbi:hypothetical protein LIER_23599 [Lithospermum erythrorhizon]|uniref:DUF4283 domain-containing protein n=1 Tax=Lithospermum erythrorhizon TaxID=34254 RepID=A0AAV3QZH3_LITER